MFRVPFGLIRSSTVVSRACSSQSILCDTAPPLTSQDLSPGPFSKEILTKLNNPLDLGGIEIKPDGIIYLPEIRYRRILNNTFGQGGWSLIPRGPPIIRSSLIFREYAMFCNGKFISQAVGDQTLSHGMNEPTAIESSKSTALMRCCKDLGIASDLWDPKFIKEWKEVNCERVWCVNEKSGEKRMLWRRKDRSAIQYPWIEQGARVEKRAFSPAQQSRAVPQRQTPPPFNPQATPPSSPPPFTTPIASSNTVVPQFQPPPATPDAPGNASTPQFQVPPIPGANSAAPQFQPPPTAPGAPGNANIPQFQVPPIPGANTAAPQFQAPPAQPESHVIPQKVADTKNEVEINTSDVAPEILTTGTPFEGKSWNDICATTEGRVVLSKACGNPNVTNSVRLAIVKLLRSHLQSKK